MKSRSKLANLALIFVCAAFLAACASTPARSTGDVEDIQPGEKSIIQPPAPATAPQSGIEERAI